MILMINKINKMDRIESKRKTTMQIKEELLDIEGIKNSKKSLLDLFIRRTAVISSTSEDLTEKIIKDQWRQANKKAQGGSSVAEIDFCNLGTFFISSAKARKKVAKINKIQTALDRMVLTDEKLLKSKEVKRMKNEETLMAIQIKTKQVNVQND